MKAYLIDPFNLLIHAVEHDGDHRDIQRHIGVDRLSAEIVGQVQTESGRVDVTLYVDDEGIYRQPQAWFTVAGFPEPIPGKALCLGTDYRGEAVEPPATLQQLAARIGWLGTARPHLADASVTDGNGVTRRIPMNGPDAPKSATEMALRIAEAQGDTVFADFIRKQMKP